MKNPIASIFFRIRSWVNLRKIYTSERMVRDLERRMQQSLTILNRKQRKLESLQKRLLSINESVLEDLEEATNIQVRYEETMTALRSENRILKDVTIPTLTAEHKRILTVVDADTAAAVRRQVSASSEGGM